MSSRQAANVDKINKKMICSKPKEQTARSSEHKDLERVLLKPSKHRWELCNANGIKAMNHILIHSRPEEGIKSIRSKLREGTAESSGATSTRNTSADAQQIVVSKEN